MSLVANDGLYPKLMASRSGKVIFLTKREADHRHRGVAHDSTGQKSLSDSCFSVFLTITLSPLYSPFISSSRVHVKPTHRQRMGNKQKNKEKITRYRRVGIYACTIGKCGILTRNEGL